MVALVLFVCVPGASAYEGWIGSMHYHDEHRDESSCSTPQRTAVIVNWGCCQS
jgi:hypothetical protein